MFVFRIGVEFCFDKDGEGRRGSGWLLGVVGVFRVLGYFFIVIVFIFCLG